MILIIGILAAIALPMFVEQRTRAYDTGAKTWAATAQKALDIYQMDHGTFAGVAVADLVEIEHALANAPDLQVVISGDATSYELSVDSLAATGGGGPYRIERTALGTTRTCEIPGKGACPEGGVW